MKLCHLRKNWSVDCTEKGSGSEVQLHRQLVALFNIKPVTAYCTGPVFCLNTWANLTVQGLRVWFDSTISGKVESYLPLSELRTLETSVAFK